MFFVCVFARYIVILQTIKLFEATKTMKKTNAFVLFGRAFKNAKADFWVSIQVLLVATVVLALLFYFVEHDAQPEEYQNPWDAFVWAITRYIGDPGQPDNTEGEWS